MSSVLVACSISLACGGAPLSDSEQAPLPPDDISDEDLDSPDSAPPNPTMENIVHMSKDTGTKAAGFGHGASLAGLKTESESSGGVAIGVMKAGACSGYLVPGRVGGRGIPLKKAVGKCKTMDGCGRQGVGESASSYQ
jgi:hypothetical protein